MSVVLVGPGLREASNQKDDFQGIHFRNADGVPLLLPAHIIDAHIDPLVKAYDLAQVLRELIDTFMTELNEVALTEALQESSDLHGDVYGFVSEPIPNEFRPVGPEGEEAMWHEENYRDDLQADIFYHDEDDDEQEPYELCVRRVDDDGNSHDLWTRRYSEEALHELMQNGVAAVCAEIRQALEATVPEDWIQTANHGE